MNQVREEDGEAQLAASANPAVDAFVETMTDFYYPPKRWEEAQEAHWSATVGKKLVGYSAEVLERAADDIVSTRTDQFLPSIPEILDACRNASRFLEAKKAADADGKWKPVEDPKVDWEELGRKAIEKIKADRIGRLAAKEGWNGGLKDFVMKFGRLPLSATEIAQCKRWATEFDEGHATITRAHGQTLAQLAAIEKASIHRDNRQEKERLLQLAAQQKAIIDLGSNMLARRQSEAQEIQRR